MRISFGVSFLTHNSATWISRKDKKYDDSEILKFGCIKIGNDCFIGSSSIILPNVTIGDKVVIATANRVDPIKLRVDKRKELERVFLR